MGIDNFETDDVMECPSERIKDSIYQYRPRFFNAIISQDWGYESDFLKDFWSRMCKRRKTL